MTSFSGASYALDVDAFLKAQADTSIPTPWSPGCAPPSTLIGVTRLSSPDFVLEVDLTADCCRLSFDQHTDHSSIEAWPFDKTKRSRFGQIGSCGSKRMTSFHIT